MRLLFFMGSFNAATRMVDSQTQSCHSKKLKIKQNFFEFKQMLRTLFQAQGFHNQLSRQVVALYNILCSG
jgi:hypothetical protein